MLKKVILEKISGKFRIFKKPENLVSLYSIKGRSHPCPELKFDGLVYGHPTSWTIPVLVKMTPREFNMTVMQQIAEITYWDVILVVQLSVQS